MIIDFNTREGLRIQKLLEGRRDVLRKKNDSEKLGLEETAYLRGRIAELSKLLLVESERMVSDDVERFGME